MRLLALAILALATAAPAQARDLMVVGFGGGFQDNARKHLFQGYARASGAAVKDDVYNGEMAKIVSMVKARDVTWDVVMVEAPELVRGCEDGTFEKLNWNVIDRNKFVGGGTVACASGGVQGDVLHLSHLAVQQVCNHSTAALSHKVCAQGDVEEAAPSVGEPARPSTASGAKSIAKNASNTVRKCWSSTFPHGEAAHPRASRWRSPALGTAWPCQRQ